MAEDEAGLQVERTENAELVGKWEGFFRLKYPKQVEALVGEYPDKCSLEVDFADLEHFDPELADELLANPDTVLDAAQTAIERSEVPSLHVEEFRPHVRVFNLPREQEPQLKSLGAHHIGKLISVEGIVRQATDVLPKLKVAEWECRRCGNTYRLFQSGQVTRQPAMCECRHRDFDLKAEKSEFTDYQKIQIQEPLEKLRGSDQPTNLDVYLSDDFVNRVSPGDRTRITGVIRLYVPKDKKVVYGRYLEALHIEETAREFEEVEISKEEEAKIKELAADPKVYEKLVKSIAPNIYGHETVKEAIALQLFGGVKKVLPGANRIRGNMHVLLVGDPGLAKSQLLMAVDNIAPKSIYTAGKTTSGVGLCVAPDSLVLNDNGFKDIASFVEEQFDEEKAWEQLPGAYANTVYGKRAHSLDTDLRVREKPVTHIWRIKAPKEMCRVETRSGRGLSLTPNTSLVRLKNARVEWVKASEVGEGDFIAVPRVLPEGSRRKIPSIGALYGNTSIRIADNVADAFKAITDKLVGKYGSVQAIAHAIGMKRDRFYLWRSRKLYHGMPLHVFVRLGMEAGYSLEWLSGRVTRCFTYYGRECRLPRYLDNEDLAYLAGLVLGDGSVYLGKTHSASIRVYSGDEALLEAVDGIVERLFGLKTEKLAEPGKVRGRRFNSMLVYRLLEAFGVSPKKKEIALSHLATEMPNRVLGKVLQGLFDTDGFVSSSVRASPSAGLSTVSEPLAKTVHLSLLKFGVLAKKRTRKLAGRVSVGKTVTVRSNNDQFYVELRGKENFKAFAREIGFGLERKRIALENVIARTGKSNPNVDLVPELKEEMERLKADWNYRKRLRPSRATLKEIAEKMGNPYLLAFAESDVLWDPVARVESFKPPYKHVYDFTVDGTHNFIANGVFVHNTASAVKDEFGEGGWTLKAGALVLASGGMAMIDEFDKMEPDERSAMHESMEQGMVSVAKAGIVTRFRTETSILAAANPKYARFDPYQNFIEQIDLPATLISRFDLFFMMQDILDREKDAKIAGHILATHQAGEMMLQESLGREVKDRKALEEIQEKVTPAIDIELMKKFIAFARKNVFPALSSETIREISDFYLDLRDSGRKEGSYAATHRQLEGLVRLSEASARVRLSDNVELEDARRAIRLFKASLEQLVTDTETGRIDIDIIAAGRSQTEFNRMKMVRDIVKSMAVDQDMVPVDDVMEEAKTQGIERDKVREILEKLDKAGDIYKPKHGFVKPTEKR